MTGQGTREETDTRPSMRKRLAAGEVLFGLGLTFPAAGILELAGGRWDWFWIDAQHGQFGYDAILSAVRAAGVVRVPPIVRVPGHDYAVIGPVLDTGVAGIMAPVVETPEEAEALVRAARFPPLGKRSYGGRRVMDVCGPGYAERAAEEVLIFVQIETVDGLDNCEKIAAVEGVDVLFVGPTDLRLSMGLDAQAPLSEPRLQAAFDRVAAACRAHGKYAATVSTSPEILEDLVRRRYQLLVAAYDSAILREGLEAKLARLH